MLPSIYESIRINIQHIEGQISKSDTGQSSRSSSSGLIRLAILFHETMKAEGMVIVLLVPCVRRTRRSSSTSYYGVVVRRSKKRALNLSKKFHQKPLLKAKRRRERGNEQKQKCSKKKGRRGEELCIYILHTMLQLAWDESYFLVFVYSIFSCCCLVT